MILNDSGPQYGGEKPEAVSGGTPSRAKSSRLLELTDLGIKEEKAAQEGPEVVFSPTFITVGPVYIRENPLKGDVKTTQKN